MDLDEKYNVTYDEDGNITNISRGDPTYIFHSKYINSFSDSPRSEDSTVIKLGSVVTKVYSCCAISLRSSMDGIE